MKCFLSLSFSLFRGHKNSKIFGRVQNRFILSFLLLLNLAPPARKVGFGNKRARTFLLRTPLPEPKRMTIKAEKKANETFTLLFRNSGYSPRFGNQKNACVRVRKETGVVMETIWLPPLSLFFQLASIEREEEENGYFGTAAKERFITD